MLSQGTLAVTVIYWIWKEDGEQVTHSEYVIVDVVVTVDVVSQRKVSVIVVVPSKYVGIVMEPVNPKDGAEESVGAEDSVDSICAVAVEANSHSICSERDVKGCLLVCFIILK